MLPRAAACCLNIKLALNMKKTLLVVLVLSVLLNVGLAGSLIYVGLMGCAETPNGKLGVLTRDLAVGRFDGRETVFTLPKGLVVRDASATGADWFEPHRFRLVITSESDGLVDYSKPPEKADDGEYYSADVQARRERTIER
jgi:hypothetical protein